MERGKKEHPVSKKYLEPKRKMRWSADLAKYEAEHNIL